MVEHIELYIDGLKSMLEEAIEKAQHINHDMVEQEIEEESNRLARKRFEIRPR